MPRLPALPLTAVFLAAALRAAIAGAEDFPAPGNSQEETTPLLSPREALGTVRAPDGFRVTLFAAEPDVRQPIALALDARGRLWVAENYTYADRRVNFDLELRDRIVVFADADGDGEADDRRVFWDGAQRLTSVELGFGGVWALCPPHLLFIPDRDGDDRPDGPPEVMLDGWDDRAVRHNFVNGLRWGPDGWLYGRHGILATSHVGRPGTPRESRVPINCGIWRFHPVRRDFEVVCNGTTNPWGADWDEHGELFFINTVIGHLWHVLPGAHYERMYGEDFNPHLYELIGQTADHYHWDTAEHWSTQRTKGLSDSSSRAGGGHAHSGLMVYLGDNWPDEYRGDIFTLNFHGRRINRDRPVRSGATYTARHRADLLAVGDPWFRGIDLAGGPDGGVFVLDWSDIGECHESDGVHRTSGRIYKVTHGAPERRALADLSRADAAELVALQRHRNHWFSRVARRVLQERAVRGGDTSAAARALRALFAGSTSVPERLRALWSLHAIGALGEAWLLERLVDGSEHVRAWAVRLLVDDGAPSEVVARALAHRARRESSGLVLSYLASALQRLELAHRWPLAGALVELHELADDPVFPRMVWYGVESVVASRPDRAIALLGRSRLPFVSRSIARRITHATGPGVTGIGGLGSLVGALGRDRDESRRLEILRGMATALRGVRKLPPPASWSEVAARLAESGDRETRELIRDVSVVFGDGRAIDDVRAVALDTSHDSATRRRAIRALVDARASGLERLLRRLVADVDLAADAVRALGELGPPGLASFLIERFRGMKRPGRVAVVEVLASRRATARELLDAVAAGTVARKDVPAFLLRQMQLIGDAALGERVAELWPELRLIDEDKLRLIAEYRKRLTPARLAAGDLTRGRALYEKSCGSCHRLFGEGGSIGPELTGAQRDNLDYWLENILDPSVTVAANWRMSIVRQKDGLVLNGVVEQRTERTITVQTPVERVVIERDRIAAIDSTELSLMPEGILDLLDEDETRDLFAYLMARASDVAAGR